jgi:hypothetical protein
MNLCKACNIDFTSLETFDAHRVGKHEYLASEDRPDGRRCLDVEEMADRSWRQDERGRWVNPTRAGRARLAFAA